ncbi:unnamed protein product [Heterosigma akashiwo]|mmetsp:Transcript_7478/g.10449  ORF Transcript_7478/g.10449 Transcript_7478/m.10449 type:complete len:220 (+) Transcript_7478:65-724(+)
MEDDLKGTRDSTSSKQWPDKPVTPNPSDLRSAVVMDKVLIFFTPDWQHLLAIASCSRFSRDAICSYAKRDGKKSFTSTRLIVDGCRIQLTVQRGNQAVHLCNLFALGQMTRRCNSFGRVVREASSFFHKAEARAQCERADFQWARNEIVLWALQNDFCVACNVLAEEDGAATNFDLKLFSCLDQTDCMYLSCLEMPSAPSPPMIKPEGRHNPWPPLCLL